MALDTDKFAEYLRKHAKATSQKQCAQKVREALEAGGANPGKNGDAKYWGPALLRIGYHEIQVDDPAKFNFMKGDIVIIQPYPGGNPAGHIAAFDGAGWYSDFVQRDFWSGPGYRKFKPSHVFYRY